MLYIGHFSFDELDDAQNVRHGYFSSIVDAHEPDAAANRFREDIQRRRQEDPLFAKVRKVYVEDIIEIGEVPTDVVLTRFQSSEGDFPRSVSHSLPDTERPGLEAYGFGPDVQDPASAASSDGYPEMRPFVEF